MIKKIFYISILILWGCDTLVEEPTPLKGEFYIQDGWLAFSSKEYEEADKYFNTAIETNKSRSVYHFLSSTGKGWTYLYNAKTKFDSLNISHRLMNQSGEFFDTALSILSDLDEALYGKQDRMNLYAGLSLQRAYSAKQKAINSILWETESLELNLEIDNLYRQSINYSFKLDNDYIFQYDSKLTYEDILILRIENYILIGEVDSAIHSYKDYGFECSQLINENSILECLCEKINNGSCPFIIQE